MYFALLGSFEAGLPNAPITITAAKQRTVLATLVLEANTEVTVDRLLASIWGQHAPASAQSTLQTYIYRLRQRLQPLPRVMLRTRSSGYVLVVDPGMTDVWAFRRYVAEATIHSRAGALDNAVANLRTGLALWRGEALASVPGQLLRQEAKVLEQERIVAYEDLFEAELARGNFRTIIPELEKVNACYPFHERFRAQLMLALYRSGRQAESLQAYSLIHCRLRDDLGIQPAAELRDLHHAILKQVPAGRLMLPSTT